MGWCLKYVHFQLQEEDKIRPATTTGSHFGEGGKQH